MQFPLLLVGALLPREQMAQTTGQLRLVVDPGHDFQVILDGTHRLQPRLLALHGQHPAVRYKTLGLQIQQADQFIGNVVDLAFLGFRLGDDALDLFPDLANLLFELVDLALDRRKPGSVKPHTHFTAEIYVLSKEEGGRHTPFFNNYRPQFYFRTTDVTGAVELPKDKEMVMPGDNVSITVKLIAPIAMEEGLRFAIREGGRTVGAGVVAKIIE